MDFETWLSKKKPNRPNNPHTIFSADDMKEAYYAGKGETMEEEIKEEVEVQEKNGKAKNTSLIAQIIAAVWVAVWCGKKFITEPCEVTDVIFSGFAIAACFCPVYFNMGLDKIKKIRFGE